MRQAGILAFVTLLSLGQPLARAQIIETVAGGGPDDIPALAANIGGPASVVVDGSGQFYIAASCRVFKVDAGGQLRVAAGLESCGFGGDGAGARSARLGIPRGLALDAAGNMFIADTGNHRIRRVDALTGVITTYAGDGAAAFGGDGGPAAAANLNGPEGLAIDSGGHLLIADRDNHRIRRVDAVAGVITTVAGDGSSGFGGDGGPATAAMLDSPSGVALHPSGDILIADTMNHRVRKVAGSTGSITTVAGNGVQGFDGDGVPATEAALSRPAGVWVDVGGSFHIADAGNHRVRRVDAATGLIHTVAGSGSSAFGGDGGPAAAAGLSSPRSVAVWDTGELLIADTGHSRVRRVEAATLAISTVAGNGGSMLFGGDGFRATAASLSSPNGIAVGPEGILVIAETNNQRVRRVDGATSVITTIAGNGSNGYGGDEGPATEARLQFPLDVAADASGNLFIGDTSNRRIRRVDVATGNITTFAGTGVNGFSGDGGPATAASLRAPRGLALDAAGNLYFADGPNQRVRRIDAATGIITTVAGNGAEGFAGDGVPATGTSLWFPSDVALDAEGNLYIADSFNDRIRRVDRTSGIITTLAGDGTFGFGGDEGPAVSARVAEPRGVAVDSEGGVLIADTFNRRIRRIDPLTGVITTLAGGGASGLFGDGGPATEASLSFPGDVVVDSLDRVLLPDGNRVRRVSVANQAPTAVVAGGGIVECIQRHGQTVLLDGSASTDPDSTPGTQDDIVSYEWIRFFGTPSEQVVGIGPTFSAFILLHEFDLDVFSLRVTDGAGASDVETVAVDVVDTAAPDISCPPPTTAECTGPQTTHVVLPPVAATDRCDPAPTFSRDEDPHNVPFASDNFVSGMTVVTYTASDSSGQTSSCSFTVAVVDTTPPQIEVAAVPAVLWPPNHRMVDVLASVQASDTCGGAMATLSSLTSSEPDDAPRLGDGHTVGDISGAEIGAADPEFALRAERDSGGPGRVYAITYEAADAAGNVSAATAFVTVPHDQNGSTDPVDLSVREVDAGTLLEWSDVSGAIFYNAVRGLLGEVSQLPDRIDLGTLVCLRGGSGVANTVGYEDAAVPALGEIYFYLVEYDDGLSSSLGEEGAPGARVQASGGCD